MQECPLDGGLEHWLPWTQSPSVMDALRAATSTCGGDSQLANMLAVDLCAPGATQSLLAYTSASVRGGPREDVHEAHRVAFSYCSLAVAAGQVANAVPEPAPTPVSEVESESESELESNSGQVGYVERVEHATWALRLADVALLVGSQTLFCEEIAEFADQVHVTLKRLLVLARGVRRRHGRKRRRGYEAREEGEGKGKGGGGNDSPVVPAPVHPLCGVEEGAHVPSPSAPPLSLFPPPLPSLPSVRALEAPSLTEFRDACIRPLAPALLTGSIAHWAALEDWRSLDYLSREAGARVVPVEVGGQYTDPASSQMLMRLDDFIEIHLTTGDASGYVAQHRIADQVRALRTAYTVPDYCACAIVDDGSSDVVTMGWLGPVGTISPCHHDPYHNLLAQVVGHKHVVLFPPGSHMYPRHDFMTNTSRIDLSAGPVDSAAYPLFSWEHATAVTLAPGDVLFMPRHWWHFIVSVPAPPPIATAAAAISGAVAHGESGASHVFSLSFWFGERILKGTNGIKSEGNGKSS